MLINTTFVKTSLYISCSSCSLTVHFLGSIRTSKYDRFTWIKNLVSLTLMDFKLQNSLFQKLFVSKTESDPYKELCNVYIHYSNMHKFSIVNKMISVLM